MTVRRNKSARYLKDKIAHLIEMGDLDQALRLIHDCVEDIITEPLCTSQIYGSKDLDALCQYIGKVNLATIRQKYFVTTIGERKRPVIAYIITKLQKSGGHSRVIEDFIKVRPGSMHIILSTELAGRSDADYLISRLAVKVHFDFESAPKGSYQKRLIWLQSRLLEIRPNKLYLFNHHQDSVAVAAIQPEMGLDAYYYHHGDHHLCLGVYLSRLKHIDPHPMGYHNCRVALGINNYYVPLTVVDRGARPSECSFMNSHGLTTCTAARSNKIEIPYFISYLDIVPQIIKSTGGKHIHIGRLSPYALYRIHSGLKRYGIKRDRFIYTPWVPSVWEALHNYKVDLYIASFPYGGGLTLIEAMGAGVPVALHKHFFSRMLSGIDLAYPGAFSWQSPDELLKFCSTLTVNYLETNSRKARIQYVKYHRSKIIEDILGEQGQPALRPNELKSEFVPDRDEWTYWMEKQVSFKRVIQRRIYRIFRYFRSKLF